MSAGCLQSAFYQALRIIAMSGVDGGSLPTADWYQNAAGTVEGMDEETFQEVLAEVLSTHRKRVLDQMRKRRSE